MNKKLEGIKVEVKIPGDKSISHRAFMISSISKGKVKINNFLYSEDLISTIRCLKNLGVKIEINNKEAIVHGNGLYSLKEYSGILDARNSGTTMRLLSGILSGHKFTSVIDGDASLRKRPMDRIVKPLSLMGANIYAENSQKFSPLHIKGNDLCSIEYKMEVDSAQVKSSILLAGLYADSITKVYENVKTRDHTERMLKYFGCNINYKDNEVYIEKSDLYSKDIFIPGDISSASFLMALFACIKNSQLTIKDVGVNTTRTGIINVLVSMGVKVEFLNKREINLEEVCDIRIYGTDELKPISINGNIIPTLIDEVPIICVLCVFAKGDSYIKDINELKYKESNRIKVLVSEFKKLGINIEEIENGIKITGERKVKGAKVKSYKDHRIAMALTILAYVSGENIVIENKECVYVSFPYFYETLKEILNY